MCQFVGLCEFLTYNWVGALGSAIGGAGTLIAAGLAFLALRSAGKAIRQQSKNSRFEKVFDAVAECNRRYDTVRKSAARRNTASRSPSVKIEPNGRIVRFADQQQSPNAIARQYFREFWSVQMEHWEYFRLGLVPREMFLAWCIARWKDFNAGGHEPVLGVEFVDGWRNYGKSQFEDMLPLFVEFVEALRAVPHAKDESGAELSQPIHMGIRSDRVPDYKRLIAHRIDPHTQSRSNDPLTIHRMTSLTAIVAFVEWQATRHRASIEQQL